MKPIPVKVRRVPHNPLIGTDLVDTSRPWDYYQANNVLVYRLIAKQLRAREATRTKHERK